MNILKKLRGNMTQDRLAKILGVSQRTYSNYETDERQIPDDIKIKLSDYFGVSVDYILGREEKPTSVGNVNGNNNETVAVNGNNNNFLQKPYEVKLSTIEISLIDSFRKLGNESKYKLLLNLDVLLAEDKIPAQNKRVVATPYFSDITKEHNTLVTQQNNEQAQTNNIKQTNEEPKLKGDGHELP